MSKERIKLLADEILKHKKLYYSGQKEIEDEEYDSLEEELKKLDPKNPVLMMVGSNFFSKDKVKHDKKMLSLDKKYKKEELISWIKDNEVLAMYKVDGSSSSLIYEDGKLSLAKTRGDGMYGENITKPLMYLDSIPKEISSKDKVEVRGEVYCSHERFSELSKEMVKRGLEKPKSPRNVVAGILGRKENIDLAKYLSFMAFDYIAEEEFSLEMDKINKLEKEGFNLPNVELIKDEKHLDDFLLHIQDFLSNGEFLIDGAVFVYNDIKEQKTQGYTSHHPKYKMAFKYQSEGQVTKLKRIDWQISKFGVYTPVGIVEPVELDGATITKVTFHNLKTIRVFNLKKGDEIKIVRSGEVIPKFLSVVKPSSNSLLIPDKCVYCSSDLKEDEVRLICENKDCSGRHKEYVLNFVKKIGVDDLSDKRLNQMIEAKLVTKVTDLYHLIKEDLLSLPQVKDKMANKILKNIEKTKKVNVVKFLSSLNFVGGARKNTELVIENGCDSFEKLFNLTEEDLLKIKGFAKKKAEDFINSLNDNKELIDELLNLGFEVSWPKVNKEGSLKGLSFCITGDLEIAENRKYLENLIKSNGGKASSSVSKNLNYLICNQKSSSSKYKKAESLNIPIITEKEFEEKFIKIN